MDKFLRFKNTNLKEEYRRHIHREVMICRNHFLFFFYAWQIFDFAITNYLNYRSTQSVYTYFDVIWSGIELTVKLLMIVFGFRYFLRRPQLFIYVDYFLVVLFIASSITTITSLSVREEFLDPMWNGFRMSFLLIIQVMTLRRRKFRTLYFILFTGALAIYAMARKKKSFDVYSLDFLYAVVLFAILNFTLELSFKQNFMEKYYVSEQESVWGKIMNIMPEGTLIIDDQKQAQFCNPAFIKFMDVDEAMSESFYESLFRVKDVTLRPDCPSLRIKPCSPGSRPSSRKARNHPGKTAGDQDIEDNGHHHHEFEPMKIRLTEQDFHEDEDGDKTYYDNLKNLLVTLLDNMVEFKSNGVGWENNEPKFFIADGTIGSRHLEIKIGYATFNEKNTVILIFTDTTESFKVARLQDKDNFKTNLLASISHELRTPLNGTISLLEGAASSDDIPEIVMKQLILPALASTKRLEYFAKDVTDFNDLYQDKLELSFNSFELRPVISELIKLVVIPAESKLLNVKVNIAEAVPSTIITDMDRMCQILINLLSNSLRFTNKGTITLDVSLDRNDPLNYVCFDVIDTGMGMSDQDKQRLIDLLASGQLGKVSQSSTGASLGISISNVLSKRLGHGLRLISSEPKKGSHFQFSIQSNRDNLLALQEVASPLSARKRQKRENRMTAIKLKRQTQNGLDSNDPYRSGDTVHERRPSEMDHLNSRMSNHDIKAISSKFEEEDLENDEINENTLSVANGKPQLAHQVLPPRRSTPIGSKRVFATVSSHTDVPTKKRPHTATKKEKSDSGSAIALPPLPKRTGWFDETECSCPDIVVVDDEQINHMAMEWILKKLNIRFEAAYNGIEALKLVSRLEQKKCGCRGIKFMLLDIGMPEMDGYETASRLKEMIAKGELKGFFIIACTAYVGDDVRKKCKRVGFDDFVNKPLTIEKVNKLQQEYFKKHWRPNIVD